MIHQSFTFIQKLYQPSDWRNCVHLSSPLESPKLVSLYLQSSSTIFDNKLERHLRSHNNVLTATHFHCFNNIHRNFFLLVIHIKKTAASPWFDGTLAGLPNIFRSPNPNAFLSTAIRAQIKLHKTFETLSPKSHQMKTNGAKMFEN